MAPLPEHASTHELSATPPAIHCTPEEATPMLDVHPAHHAASTWRDFFIHIATICVGLLIAIGLEQSVEALHHRHQGAELRESLQRENDQIVQNARDTDAAVTYHLAWLTKRVEQVKDTVWQHKPLAPPSPYALPDFAYPVDSIWRSAKVSGLTQRLSQPEVNAYSEIELLSGKVDSFYDIWRNTQNKRIQFENQFPQKDGVPDLTPASTQDMRTYLALLSDEAQATRIFRIWIRCMGGAEDSIVRGDLGMTQIFAAEKKFSDPSLP
jgi:hypothetical protein